MSAATIAATTASNIAIQNAMRQTAMSGNSSAATASEDPVVVAGISLFFLMCISCAAFIRLVYDHPVIGAAILMAAVVFCAVWYVTCY